MLATCWQHVGNMVVARSQHAGNILLSLLKIETFSQKCPLSSPYSVLLGARLVAIRAQKYDFTPNSPVLINSNSLFSACSAKAVDALTEQLGGNRWAA